MRTHISQLILGVISTHLDERNAKGFDEYKETLDDVPFENYDWNLMALEEMTDCAQYLMKENLRLREEIRQLKLRPLGTLNGKLVYER